MEEPYLIDPGEQIGMDAVGWRMADSDEIFSDANGQALIPRFIFAYQGRTCSMAITFEYLDTLYAHTVYSYDPNTIR